MNLLFEDGGRVLLEDGGALLLEEGEVEASRWRRGLVIVPAGMDIETAMAYIESERW